MNEALKRRLMEMAEEDHRVRSELAATGELSQGYAPRMAEVHFQNAQALADILERYGWPGKSLVGTEGSSAAWLIVQHAIGNPQLQRKCLPLLQRAVADGEAEPVQFAYLEDRIRFFERRPQRYGTQFDWDENGRMNPWTLEDPDKVDEYRFAVGLPPLVERIAEERANKSDAECPPDFHRRQAEMLDWARSVGWL